MICHTVFLVQPRMWFGSWSALHSPCPPGPFLALTWAQQCSAQQEQASATTQCCADVEEQTPSRCWGCSLTLANLLTMRPVGVVSKKLMGARRMLLSICWCMMREARTLPRADSTVAKSRKIAARRPWGWSWVRPISSWVTLAPGTLWLDGCTKQCQASSSAASCCDNRASHLLGRPQQLRPSTGEEH